MTVFVIVVLVLLFVPWAYLFVGFVTCAAAYIALIVSGDWEVAACAGLMAYFCIAILHEEGVL